MNFSEQEKEAQLRLEAESRLKSGTQSAVPGHWTVGPEALGLLYRLASCQDSAPDALKLLQELQVHQVELGLQHEQMAETERETAETLGQYQELYEWAPLGYVVVAGDGAIVDVNRAGISLFGVGRDALVGRTFDWFLSAESRPAMQNLRANLRSEGDVASCTVRFNQSGLAARIDASVPPGGETMLMMVSELQDSREA